MSENKYSNLSLVDIAYEIALERNDPISFKELFEEVASRALLNEEKKSAVISSFFTNLSLDGRFVALKNNEWDLRARQKFEKVHVDLNAIYEDIENDEEKRVDEIEDEDEKILRGDYGDEDIDDDYSSSDSF